MPQPLPSVLNGVPNVDAANAVTMRTCAVPAFGACTRIVKSCVDESQTGVSTAPLNPTATTGCGE